MSDFRSIDPLPWSSDVRPELSALLFDPKSLGLIEEEADWHVWDGHRWVPSGWDRVPVLVQPSGLGAMFRDRIAECCRHDWIEEEVFLLAMPVGDAQPKAVSTGLGDERDDVDTRPKPRRRPVRRSLQQHVRLPSPEVLDGVGQVFRHGDSSFPMSFACQRTASFSPTKDLFP
jgi:hypothetical protein